MKRSLGFLLIGLIFCSIVYLFWVEEFVPRSSDYIQYGYNPMNYTTIQKRGIHIVERPVYIHFYDPSCRFSRTNIEHLKNIFNNFENQVDIYVVIKSSSHVLSFNSESNTHLPEFIKIIRDPQGDLFKLCGVNSTPYALILDCQESLYFEGNYTNGFTLCGPSNIKQSMPLVALRSKISGDKLPLYPKIKGFGCNI